jgi:hypothetical protein
MKAVRVWPQGFRFYKRRPMGGKRRGVVSIGREIDAGS